MKDRFKDKVVIVTGAASGIGEATARRVSAEGAAVVLVDRQREALEKIAGEFPRDRTSPMSPTSRNRLQSMT
jgi:meso-butanediol dehydrogenase/(S,S)-butanediol dehydrogenase/diacetyl reductase